MHLTLIKKYVLYNYKDVEKQNPEVKMAGREHGRFIGLWDGGGASLCLGLATLSPVSCDVSLGCAGCSD